MVNVAGRLRTALINAGVPVIGDSTNRATWCVQPSSLQSAAQPVIAAFDPADPAWSAAELDTAVKGALDNERLISAVVWKIILAFEAQPWK